MSDSGRQDFTFTAGFPVTPPIIHQSCGTVMAIVTFSGLGSFPPQKHLRCPKCDVTLVWPNVQMQYQQTAPQGPPPNRIEIVVRSYYEDQGDKPITTDFPIACSSAEEAERISNKITCAIRKLLETLNVQNS